MVDRYSTAAPVSAMPREENVPIAEVHDLLGLDPVVTPDLLEHGEEPPGPLRPVVHIGLRERVTRVDDDLGIEPEQEY
jgi:hypothetical protein